jgi:hypothetical protein
MECNLHGRHVQLPEEDVLLQKKKGENDHLYCTLNPPGDAAHRQPRNACQSLCKSDMDMGGNCCRNGSPRVTCSPATLTNSMLSVKDVSDLLSLLRVQGRVCSDRFQFLREYQGRAMKDNM